MCTTAALTCSNPDGYGLVPRIDHPGGELRDAGRLREPDDVEAAVPVRVPDVVRLLVVGRGRHRERPCLHGVHGVVPGQERIVEVGDLAGGGGVADVGCAEPWA